MDDGRADRARHPDALRKIRLPSIVGCALGFAAAGSGIGSILGLIIGGWIWPPLPEGQGTVLQRLMAQYGGTVWGILIGTGLGLIAGIAYAVLVRRSQRTLRPRPTIE